MLRDSWFNESTFKNLAFLWAIASVSTPRVLEYSVFQSAEVQKLWVLGKRQEAKGKGEEKQVYLTRLGNAIYLDFSHRYLLQYPKTGSSGVYVEGRRIGIIWVHLNLVEISRGRFGRTQLRLPF